LPGKKSEETEAEILKKGEIPNILEYSPRMVQKSEIIFIRDLSVGQWDLFLSFNAREKSTAHIPLYVFPSLPHPFKDISSSSYVPPFPPSSLPSLPPYLPHPFSQDKGQGYDFTKFIVSIDSAHLLIPELKKTDMFYTPENLFWELFLHYKKKLLTQVCPRLTSPSSS
jgi:hypothetical protein